MKNIYFNYRYVAIITDPRLDISLLILVERFSVSITSWLKQNPKIRIWDTFPFYEGGRGNRNRNSLLSAESIDFCGIGEVQGWDPVNLQPPKSDVNKC